MILRLVIRDCRNTAKISAAKAYAGGIVGNMAVGAVFHGMNTGNIDALSANYAGGIAGSCETYIVDSFSRGILAGNQYVGGIAGYGTEVVGCYAVTDIAAATKFAGGILGHTDPLPDEEMELILENRYYLTGKNLGGIDGVSYEGATAPMTIEEFLAVETLDECFRTVTVRFVSEGSEDVVLAVDLGKTLAAENIPELAVGEQEQYHWQLVPGVTSETLAMGETARVQYISKERLTNIVFDQTYKAVFDAKNTVVASEEKTASGRPLVLAVGVFDQNTALHLTEITEQEPGVDGVTLQEVWQVAMTDMGVEKLHYRIPEGVAPEQIVLYVKDHSGSWAQRGFTVEGSYMIFSFAHEDRAFALEVLPEEEVPVVTIAIAAGAVLLLLIGTGIVKKRRAKQKGPAGEKN